MYGRETLTLNAVQSVLDSRALQNKVEVKSDTREGLSVRGRTKRYNLKHNNQKGR